MAESVAEVLAMLLPPGLLFDSPQIYAEVAKLPVVPLEDIQRHWHAYTSMYKKLQDPTACRLEHFWWHVWGSDRRNLSGKTLAALWQDIASGPTFVPLLGPPRIPQRPQKPHTRSMHESDQVQPCQRGQSNASQDDYQTSGPDFTAPSNLTPSSSRPPPAHPILKKPRGPSNSGPRPTARFVDVPDSEEETSVRSSSSQQSGNGAVSQSDNAAKNRTAASRSRSPAAKPEKKGSAGKKFVASTTTSKRRPMLPRRQSSQSSAGSATSDRDGNISSNRQGASQGSSNASSRDNSPSRKQGSSGLSSPMEGQGPKNKASEKRSTTEATTEKRSTARPNPQINARLSNATTSRMTNSPLSQEQNFADMPARKQNDQSTTTFEASPAQLVTVQSVTPVAAASPSDVSNTTSVSLKSQSLQSKLARSMDTPVAVRTEGRGIHTANGTTNGKQSATPDPAKGQPESNGAPPMTRSKSNNEPKRVGSSAAPAANFKSPSVVGMSSIAVTGGFDFETPRARVLEDELPVLGADQPDIRKPSVLDSKLAPTQPSSTPAPPMARSKSQLTLLLERDKARIGDKK